MKNVGRITNKDKDVIGREIQAQVTKTRFGPTFRTAKFDIHYDSGIQNLASWWDYMKEKGLIVKAKSGYAFKMCDDLTLTSDQFVKTVNSDPAFKEKVYDAICNKYIMTYRPANSQIVEEIERQEADETETSSVDVTASGAEKIESSTEE
jgi:hypothetical protein